MSYADLTRLSNSIIHPLQFGIFALSSSTPKVVFGQNVWDSETRTKRTLPTFNFDEVNKRSKKQPVNKVHERRRTTQEYRRKQFHRRRDAIRAWRKDRAARRIKRTEDAELKDLKREDRKKRKSPLCPLDTCPKRFKKNRSGNRKSSKEHNIGSPSSIITHISNDSGRRSRTPIHFGATSC